jgi:integrase
MEEVDQLVAATPNLYWQTVILLGFYLRARLSDCVAMTWDNVEGIIMYLQKTTEKEVVVHGQGTRQFARRTFHSLRHSFSSELANAGFSEEIRMKLTGHRSAEIHRKYTHVSNAPLKQAIASLWPAPRRQAVP